jgi:hypothetical protein
MFHRICALGILATLAPFALGCSASYRPLASPRVSLVMEGGQYAYVRDGNEYSGGLLGGDIEEAVRGNEKAEEYAHEYKNGMLTGFLLTLLGLAGVGTGAAITGEQSAETRGGQSLPPTGLLVMGGGLLVETIGLIVELSAQPHLTDAINAYNDGLGLGPAAQSSGTRSKAGAGAR